MPRNRVQLSHYLMKLRLRYFNSSFKPDINIFRWPTAKTEASNMLRKFSKTSYSNSLPHLVLQCLWKFWKFLKKTPVNFLFGKIRLKATYFSAHCVHFWLVDLILCLLNHFMMQSTEREKMWMSYKTS